MEEYAALRQYAIYLTKSGFLLACVIKVQFQSGRQQGNNVVSVSQVGSKVIMCYLCGRYHRNANLYRWGTEKIRDTGAAMMV